MGAAGTITDPGNGKTVQVNLISSGAEVRVGQRLLLYRGVTEGDLRKPGKLVATAMVTAIRGASCQARVLASAGDLLTGDVAITLTHPPQ